MLLGEGPGACSLQPNPETIERLTVLVRSLVHQYEEVMVRNRFNYPETLSDMGREFQVDFAHIFAHDTFLFPLVNFCARRERSMRVVLQNGRLSGEAGGAI